MKLPSPPSAILFYTEAITGILQALQQINLTVGKDVSLIGYDDLDIAKTSIPKLTTMCPPMKDAANQLVRNLIFSNAQEIPPGRDEF